MLFIVGAVLLRLLLFSQLCLGICLFFCIGPVVNDHFTNDPRSSLLQQALDFSDLLKRDGGVRVVDFRGDIAAHTKLKYRCKVLSPSLGVFLPIL